MMQTVNELPFADYKGNLPAPHTLQELKEAAERGEYSTYSEVCPLARCNSISMPQFDPIGSL
jgi:hypothetical protein